MRSGVTQRHCRVPDSFRQAQPRSRPGEFMTAAAIPVTRISTRRLEGRRRRPVPVAGGRRVSFAHGDDAQFFHASDLPCLNLTEC